MMENAFCFILKALKNITREIFSFKNHAENEAGRKVSDLFLFFIKDLR